MFLELAWSYVPVAVVVLFWAVAMRPVLRLIHLSPDAVPGGIPPRRARGARRVRPSGR